MIVVIEPAALCLCIAVLFAFFGTLAFIAECRG